MPTFAGCSVGPIRNLAVAPAPALRRLPSAEILSSRCPPSTPPRRYPRPPGHGKLLLLLHATPPSASAAAAMAETDADKLRFIEDVTTNVAAEQSRVLSDILTRNADAEYLTTHCGLTGATTADRAAFRAKVPMATYADVHPYIHRITHAGDRSPILSGSTHPATELLATAGTTTGARKLIPVVADDHARHHRLHSLAMAVVNHHVPGLDAGTGLYFLFARSSEPTTPGGLPARTALTKIFSSGGFWKLPYNPERGLTTPAAAIVCADAFQSTYAQLLCGLRYRAAVLRVGAAFASGLLRAVRFFRRHWEQLADDIDAGTLTDRVTDPDLRQAIAAAGGVLRRPDPELARLVRDEGSRGDAAGVIRRLWPNAKFVHVVATGSEAHYVEALNYYSGGGLPVVTTAYFSSECGVGINLRPMCDPAEVAFTVMPNMAYFEFLPTDNAGDGTAASASELVELAGVEVGREYELVVTTYAGLCRYRVGDVLRVTGFHNTAPQLRFVRRNNMFLSVAADDKTDEAELQRAVDRATAALLRPRGAAVADYAARTSSCAAGESETVLPGHYVVYWELMQLQLLGGGGEGSSSSNADVVEVVGGEVVDRCCLEMEEALGEVYRRCRVVDGSVGPLEIRVVRPGTFDELADLAVARGASVGQYKVPRCVVAALDIELLDSRVVSSHFSPGLPRW